MILKRFAIFLLCVILFHIGRSSIYAYRVSLEARGNVLGADDGGYTYVVRAKPTAIPTATPTLADTPTPTITATPTPTDQFVSMPDLLVVRPQGNSPNAPNSNSNGGGNQGGQNDGGSQGGGGGGGGSLPTPTSTPIPLCGSIRCYSSQTCYENICRERCAFDGSCLGAYHCVSGACLPNSTNPSGNTVQAPTATPPFNPQNNTAASSSSPPSSTSSTPRSPNNNSSSSQTRPTNTPYPTRTPVNQTFYNKTGSDNPEAPAPLPTPIPDALRGKISTIVVEMPAPTPDPDNPTAPVPAPTPIILKGEDMKVIKINLAQGDQAAQTDTESIQDLDITIEAKKGMGVEVNQQEFVIQKGVKTVTISANEKKQGTLVIEKNDTKARITMGLSIDPNTNILTVDTPNGPMKVSIMPDDALAIARQLKVVDKDKPPVDMAIETDKGQLQYKLSAQKEEKLFWIVPLSIPRDVYVAADTGSLLAIKQSPVWDFITLFTF